MSSGQYFYRRVHMILRCGSEMQAVLWRSRDNFAAHSKSAMPVSTLKMADSMAGIANTGAFHDSRSGR